MNKQQIIRLIPTDRLKSEVESILSHYDEWMYEFKFSNGASTSTMNELSNTIHQQRANLVLPLLDETFKGRWNEIRCLDIACSDGYFTTQIALRGAREVIGVDVRDDHLVKATAIKQISNLKNLSYQKENLYNMTKEQYGTFELTLFLGVLYHLDNPIGALKNVRSLTKNFCMIETQVVRPNTELECLWGGDTSNKKGPTIAVIKSDPNHVEGDQSVVLVPTLEALYVMLYSVGFDRIYLTIPPQKANEQFLNYDRVIVIAQVLETE